MKKYTQIIITVITLLNLFSFNVEAENYDLEEIKNRISAILNQEVVTVDDNNGALLAGLIPSFRAYLKGVPGHLGFDAILYHSEIFDTEIQKMASLKTQYPKSGWVTAYMPDDSIPIRRMRIGDYNLTFEENWSSIQNWNEIDLDVSGCGTSYFNIRLPADFIGQEIYDFLLHLTRYPPEFRQIELWGINVDAFLIPHCEFTILKGNMSSIYYKEKEDTFLLGGLWGSNAKVLEVNENTRTLKIDNGDRVYNIQIIDTTMNNTCSGYKVLE